MNVLITGGMGVIGSMAAHRFVEEGHRPVLMARHVDKGLIRLIENQVDIERRRCDRPAEDPICLFNPIKLRILSIRQRSLESYPIRTLPRV